MFRGCTFGYMAKIPIQKKEEVLKILQEIASKGDTIFYRDLYSKVGYDINSASERKIMNKIIERIGIDELKENRPPLNALVVSELTRMPKGGFFEWYMTTEDAKEAVKTNILRHLWLKKRCYEQWGKENEDYAS